MPKEPKEDDKSSVKAKVEAMNAEAAAKKKWPTDTPEPEVDDTAEQQAEQPEVEPTQGGLEHPEYAELEAKLTEMEQQVHAHWNEMKRAKAEVENIQKRADRDIINARKFALDKFCQDLLPIADGLERGLAEDIGDNTVAATFREGMALTLDLLLKTLSQYGVEQVDPTGEVFDPAQHEAVSMQEDPDAKPNTVLIVVQKGYTMHDRIIRPALVIVAKG